MSGPVTIEDFHSRSIEQTLEFGQRLAERLDAGDCVALIGDLGAGKTLLVRGLSAGLGLADERMVSSPTFVLVQEYPGRVPIYHIDLYRLANPRVELPDLGLDEMLSDGVVLIEWAERAGDALPSRRWEIRFEITGAESRLLRVRRHGDRPQD